MAKPLTHRSLAGIQPYYAAWLVLTGGGPNWEYIAWNGRMWRTFLARHGYRADASKLHAPQFGDWLADISGLAA